MTNIFKTRRREGWRLELLLHWMDRESRDASEAAGRDWNARSPALPGHVSGDNGTMDVVYQPPPGPNSS